MSTEQVNIEEENKVVYSSDEEDDNPLNFDIYEKDEIDSVIQRNAKRDPNNKKRPKISASEKKIKNVPVYQSDKILERSKLFKDPVFAHFTTYTFVKIDDLEATKKELVEATKNICGTVLIGKEGINLFVSGIKEDIDEFEKYVLNDEKFKGCYIKKGFSKEPAYRKMMVKIKKEIVTMGVDDLCPIDESAPHLPPKQLHEWLENGKDIVVLDTRNDYEYRMGTFKSAKLLPLKTFREFPKLAEELDIKKDATIVSFCTGGIRCEKAAPLLIRNGFTNTYQLDGGILRYFEELGEDAKKHYEGECFVFDRRVGVDTDLNETPSELCFVCREPISEAEQKLETYKVGVHCPYCINKTKDEIRQELKRKEGKDGEE